MADTETELARRLGDAWRTWVVAGCLSCLAACTGQIGGPLGQQGGPTGGSGSTSTGTVGTGMTAGGTATGSGTGSTTSTGTGPAVPGTDPGRVTLHRLNRTEYNNTVRDLFGTALTPADDFPVDDSGAGFDNMADVLSISPVLLSLYQNVSVTLVNEALANATQRAKIVTCDLAGAQGATCARTVITNFAPLAWRRPITDAEVNKLNGLVAVATSKGDNVEQGLKLAMQAMVMSPNFIFRVELDPAPTATAPHPLGGYELASRLSYFLWSSMPDDQLFASAKDGSINQPAKLASEVTRMLQSPKAQALIDNFAGQWLYFRKMDEVTPDPGVYAQFDDKLRAAMKQESQLLFKDLVSGAVSADKLITADYTYANDRLAMHYGLPAPGSATPVKVNLAGNTQRGGFLSQGTFLTATSHTTRTSPVVRGKWILGQMLCTDIAPPPKGVDVTFIDKATGTQRERLEAHRTNPTCAACHGLMDSIGLGLENYDGIGAYRTMDSGSPIDSTGNLPNGKTFTGALELERLVASDSQYAECLVKNLYTYALGRTPDTTTPNHMDPFTIQSLADTFRQGGYNLRDLVGRVTTSATFTSRRGEAP